jgi:zinc-finger of transposase IS204/IS1001/IS1096/IS1165
VRDIDFFAKLLRLKKPWKVNRVSVSTKEKRVEGWLEHRPRAEFVCPECHLPLRIYDHVAARRWRHHDHGECRTWLHGRIPRVYCLEHGARQPVTIDTGVEPRNVLSVARGNGMKGILKAILTATIGETRFGGLEYRVRKSLRAGFGGPLNGSPIRRQAFEGLLKTARINAIVETGTYRGTTTEYMADTGLPVYTVEAIPRFFGFASARLKNRANVHLILGDSRSFLTKLAGDPAMPKSEVFFYLDAHWYKDLPLRDEVTLIFGRWTNAIVMIDDFCVPHDIGYNYDDYGNGLALCLAYLGPVADLGVRAFFPAAPSTEEVGPKRGWVVLAKDSQAVDNLRGIPQIREWTGPIG